MTSMFHICWYGNVYIQCHMLYILFHLWNVTSDNQVADVKCHDTSTVSGFCFFVLVMFFGLSSILGRILYMLTLCHFDLLIPPVWNVHPVNLLFYLLVYCLFMPVNFPHDSWGRSQMWALTPQGHTNALWHASCAYVYILYVNL